MFRRLPDAVGDTVMRVETQQGARAIAAEPPR
jgi:hypothetical protein